MKIFGLTCKRRSLLLIEVLATIGLFSILIVSLGSSFSQLKKSRQELIIKLELMHLVQNAVFAEKQKRYQDPTRYIEIKKEQEIRTNLLPS